MAIRHRFHGRALALGALAVLAFAGCGGGGSSSAPTTGLPPGSGVGAVGIVLTDAPVVGWDRAMATITRIDLLGDEGMANVFTGSETVDLLDLGNYSEVFHLASSVPAGTYDKIRVNLSGLELQKLDDTGGVAESADVTIPGGGRIDLNPRGTFQVSPDSTLMVQLDFDMEKSLKIMSTGNGRIMMRPVVFVSVLENDGFDRFTRVHGLVDALGTDGFRICQTGLTSRDGSDDEHDDDADSRHCLDVALAPDAGVFDTNGDPTDTSGIEPGVELTVIGALRRDDNDTLYADDDSNETASAGGSDDDSADDDSGDDDSGDDDSGDDSGDDHHFDGDVVLVGHVVEFGPAGTFQRYRGEATSTVDGAGQFGLALGSGQGFPDGTTITGLVQPGTKIISRQALPLVPQDIDAGVAGLFEGVLHLSDTDPDLLKTSFIVLDLEAGSDVLRGVIQQVLTTDNQLIVTAGGVERCVAAADARVFLVESGDTYFSSQEVTLADLEPGFQADAYGTEDACFQARYIFAEAAESVGNVAPTADAGPDQSVAPGDSVQLDGTGSTDPDGDPLSFSWTLTSVPTGSGATLSDASAAQPTFTADLAGTYEAQLVVNDGALDSAADTVLITANEPPVGVPALPTANAGPDQSVTTGDTVQLDGTGSTDPSGSGLTYAWSFASVPTGSTASLSDPASATPSFVADLAGDYSVELVVSNTDGDSLPDAVLVTASDSTGGLDGAQLYADNCAMCHGPLTTSEKLGATAADIQAAIDSGRGGMDSLSFLTPEEIQAIADALAP